MGQNSHEGTAVLQTLDSLDSNESYSSGEPDFVGEGGQELHIAAYLDVFRRRFFYFLLPFALVSIVGLWLAAIQAPTYVSEGKILVEQQDISSDLVKPVVTATASERVQLIQQRVITRDNLLSIANKFGLFPHHSDLLDLMDRSIKIKPIELNERQGGHSTAFTIGFEYEKPEIAMRVANELVTLIISEDQRSRTSRATEMVKLLTNEAKDLQNKLENTQNQIMDIARRPPDEIPATSDRQKSQMAALAALRAELIQKSSVYSDAHPAVIALKKRITAMEKTITQPLPGAEQAGAPIDDIEGLKRQREALEKQLAEANAKLSSARLSEKLDQTQQTERMQLIEAPTLPKKPVKSNRIKLVGIAFAAAAILGLGSAIGAEFLNGSIRGRHELAGIVASPLIVCIPYIETRADISRARLKKILGFVSVILLLIAWGALGTAIVYHLPVGLSLFGAG
jgi:uncharacterized protein involved in exopolysaccharide biosynthesis